MKRASGIVVLVVSLAAACGGDAPTTQTPAGPSVPPLQLRPLIGELKTLAAKLVPPAEAAQRELRELGDLALVLVEADARTAGRAERSLCEHPDAAWVLEPALAHERAEVRRRAAWLCGQTGQAVLQLPLLLRLKYETDPEAVVWVADALQRLGNDLGLAWLDAAIPVAATAEAAGTAAVAALRARQVALSEQPTWEEIRRELQQLSARWQAEGRSALPDAPAPDTALLEARFAAQLVTFEGTLLRPIDDAKYILGRAGQLPVAILSRMLAASESYLRTRALEVLERIGPAARAAGPAVLPLLGDPLTASYAVRTLGELGDPTVLPYVRPLLGHIDTELRVEACKTLGLLRDEPSRAALRARLDDPNEVLDVRVAAAFGLRCFGDDAPAEAFLAERAAKKDYHESQLTQLRDRLASLAK